MSKMYDLIFNRPLAIDLDNPSEIELLTRYLNLKAVFNNIKIVKTQHGYHLIVPDVKSDLESRYEFGDCPGRLHHSELRGGDDVLFNIKGVMTRYGLKLFHDYEIDEYNILCLPFVSKIPRGYYVKKKRRRANV